MTYVYILLPLQNYFITFAKLLCPLMWNYNITFVNIDNIIRC